MGADNEEHAYGSFAAFLPLLFEGIGVLSNPHFEQ
jgi:hypothetical protein